MSFLKTGLIFSLIKRVIVTIFKAVYAILSFFNLHLTLLVGLVGLVLFLTGVFDKYPSVQTGFHIAIIASVLVAIFVTIRKLLGLSDKKRKRKGIEIMEVEKNAESEEKTAQTATVFSRDAAYGAASLTEGGQLSRQTQTAPSSSEDDFGKIVKYPVYYAVKQNQNYIMAEYADRYELYFKDRNGLKKIRTDLKTENKW